MSKLWGYILPLIIISVSTLGSYFTSLPKEVFVGAAIVSLPKNVEAEIAPQSLVLEENAETNNNTTMPEKPPITKPDANTKALAKTDNIKITENNVWQILDGLIQCESKGKREALNPNDMGSPSFGELQFKQKTWDAWSKESGITGSPMNRADAIKMAHWALLNNLGYHWSCYGYAIKNL